MDELFLSVLHMSLTASYVILFVMLVRLPLKKAPKVISYALWGAAAFRLICPFSFESIFSLFPSSTASIPQSIANRQIPKIVGGITPAVTPANSSLPAVVPTEASGNFWQNCVQAGAFIWLFGISAMLVYSIVSVLILKRRLKNAQYAEQNIYEADNLKTPFVLGVFRPRIYIPAGLAAEEKSYIVRHERTHIRRFDHVVKPFAFLILSIHWFNPLVWAAFVLMGTDMELSCDERVIREMGGGIKKAYSTSLLSLASEKRILNGSPLAFGEGNVRGRIKNVLNYKKPAFWIIVVAAACAVCVGVGLIANPKTSEAKAQNDDYKNKKQPVSLTDFVMADSGTTLSNGEKVAVQLVMTSGEYFDQNHAAYGGNTYKENYQGSYEIRVLNSGGKQISGIKFDNPGSGDVNFAEKFDLLFDDYNRDGNPDFAIGQWRTSGAKFYRIYTVLPDGTVKNISSNAEIFQDGDYTKDFSLRFEKDGKSGFYTTAYDNSSGQTKKIHYLWDESKGSFYRGESAVLSTANSASSNNSGFSNVKYPAIKRELSQIPQKYPVENAVADGCLVIANGKIKSDVKIADRFIADGENGKSIKIVQYTTEGDPIITKVVYDGNVYYGAEDDSRDASGGGYFEFDYPYLKIFQSTGGHSFYLVKDDSLTLDKIRKSYLSSKSADSIDCRFLFTIPTAAPNSSAPSSTLGSVSSASPNVNENLYVSKWEQADRLRYVEGTVESLKGNANGSAVLDLKVITNYHSGTDPIDTPDAPYRAGTVRKFVLRKAPQIKIGSGDDVVIYECTVSPENSDANFAGAVVLYRKAGGKYLDTNGNSAAMPPKDYPSFVKAFQ